MGTTGGTIRREMYRPFVTPARLGYAALLALTLALTLALRYPTFFEPKWYGDEGIFAAIASSIRSGDVLYADAWDNKPPLIFFTYAGIQSLFGTGMLPLHVAATVAVLTAQAALIATATLLAGPRRALIAALVFAALMGTPLLEGNLALTETFMIAPVALAVLATVVASRQPEQRRAWLYLLAGVLAGIGASYKQVAVFDALALAVVIWSVEDRPLPALASLAAGFALPHVALSTYFASQGALADYWDAVYVSLVRYPGVAGSSPLARAVGFVPALVVLAWLATRRRGEHGASMRALPVVWLAFAVAGATASKFAFPHYLQQAAAPLALFIAIPPFQVEDRFLPRVALAAAALAGLFVVNGQFGEALQQRRQLDPRDYYEAFVSHARGHESERDYQYYFDGRVETVRDVATLVRADGAGDTLFAWADLPWVYVEAGARNPTPYTTSFMSTLPPGGMRQTIVDLLDAPPAYVLMSDSAFTPFPALDVFVAQRYVLLDQQGDWRLYRLATLAGRLPPERLAVGDR